MVYCLVPGCNSGSARYKQDPHVMVHAVPKDEVMAAKWIRASKRADVLNLKGYVCSRHFTTDDYERDLKFELLNPGVESFKNKNRRLKATAIPSQNLPRSAGSTWICGSARKRESGSRGDKKIQAKIIFDSSSADSVAEPEW